MVGNLLMPTLWSYLLTGITSLRAERQLGGGARIQPTSTEEAYAIVEIQEALPNFVGAHELGHLYGLNHQICGDGEDFFAAQTGGCVQNPPFGTTDYGWNWVDERTFSNDYQAISLMHEQTAGFQETLNISNPDVIDEDRPTGTINHNNVRELENRDAVVANFDTRTLLSTTAQIDGPAYINQYEQNTWEAVWSCASEQPTFRWNVSYDGYNYTEISTGEVLTYQENSSTDFLTLRVRVFANNRIAYGYKQVGVTPYSGGGPFYRNINPAHDVVKDPGFASTPNPAFAVSSYDFDIKRAGAVKLEVVDARGATKIILIDEDLEPNHYEGQADVAGLQEGVYFYHLSTPSGTASSRLVVRR